MNENIRIAIVDDHTILRKGLAAILNTLDNFEVISDAENGAELIKKLRHTIPLPHVCIVDINMPVMDGYETTKEICRLFPGVNVLALTMYVDEFNILRMFQSGATGYLSKDCSVLEMQKAIISMYKENFYYSHLVTAALKRMVKYKSQQAKTPLLTEKEIKFLSLCCTDLTYTQIAAELFISPRTIQNYTEELAKKININTRLELAMFAIKVGIATFNKKIA